MVGFDVVGFAVVVIFVVGFAIVGFFVVGFVVGFVVLGFKVGDLVVVWWEEEGIFSCFQRGSFFRDFGSASLEVQYRTYGHFM